MRLFREAPPLRGSQSTLLGSARPGSGAASSTASPRAVAPGASSGPYITAGPAAGPAAPAFPRSPRLAAPPGPSQGQQSGSAQQQWGATSVQAGLEQLKAIQASLMQPR